MGAGAIPAARPEEDYTMTDEGPAVAANPGYIESLIASALQRRAGDDPAEAERVERKLARFRAVLEGMHDGSLSIGSRTPVEGAPTWATLEVVRGGFATGALLAGGPLLPHEQDRLRAIDAGGFVSERAALNAYHLTEPGLAELSVMLRDGTFRLEIPEEGALLAVTWLLKRGERERAADLLVQIAPFFDRLRFYPIPHERPLTESSVVHREPAGRVADALRRVAPSEPVQRMRAALAWTPFADRVVELLLETVEGPAPTLARDALGALERDRHGDFIAEGGTVGARVSDAWRARAKDLLAEFDAARATLPLIARFTRPTESFPSLLSAVRALADGGALGSTHARVRRLLATTLRKRGGPGSDRLARLRSEHARVRATPLHASLGELVATRLSSVPPDEGIPALAPFLRPVEASEERSDLPAGAEVPARLADKLLRALQAPIEELVRLGVIPSGEVLAEVTPQISAHVRATGIGDPHLRRLYSAEYEAFRRRRSLLLLNLARQVQFEELPWIAAIDAFRDRRSAAQPVNRQTLEQLTTLAIVSFPQAILPNKLLQEIRGLVAGAALAVPLVEEIAADIFMGTFTGKFADAARQSAELLKDSLYARYYDIPVGRLLAMAPGSGSRTGHPLFAALCRERASAAGSARGVAYNGMILEQQQVLTTANLAPLVSALSLRERIGEKTWGELAERCLAWILSQLELLARPAITYTVHLRRVKNCAYAWRQMLFFLSLLRPSEQVAFVATAARLLSDPAHPARARFAPAIRGLGLVVDGGRFAPDGAGIWRDGPALRFLGWTVGSHWLLAGSTVKRQA
jgi:hypothetical protein